MEEFLKVEFIIFMISSFVGVVVWLIRLESNVSAFNKKELDINARIEKNNLDISNLYENIIDIEKQAIESGIVLKTMGTDVKEIKQFVKKEGFNTLKKELLSALSKDRGDYLNK